MKDLDLWVLAGQSNMAGSGFGGEPETPSDRVWLYTLQDQWKIAEEPFAPDRYDAADEAFAIMRGEFDKHVADPNYRKQQAATWRGAGTGLGLTFGKELGRPVGLIYCAKGDTSMEQWSPDYAGHPYMALYKATLRRIRKVGRPITGILWDQGASDTFDGRGQLYRQRMEKLVAAFRRDLNQPDLPFYYGQLGCFPLQTNEELPEWNLVQETQRQLEPVLAPGGMVAGIDLPLCDWGHYSTAGLKRLGQRFAKIVCGKTGPRPVAVERTADPRVLEVRYDSVNGTLLPKDRVAGFVVQWPDSDRNMVCAALARQSSVTVTCIRPIPPGSTIRYGYGVAPFCNLTDAEDLAAPVFGPWKV